MMVYFFIPMRVTLRIPNGQIVCFTVPLNPVEDDNKHIGSGWDDEHGYIGVESSIRIHQITRQHQDVYTEAALEAANSAFPAGRLFPTNEPRAQHPSPTVTVIEATTYLADTSEEAMSDACDRVIESIRSFQRGYVATTGHLIPLLSLAQLPVGIPFAIRHAKTDERHPAWPDKGDLFLTNLFDPYIAQLSYSEDSKDNSNIEDISQVGQAIDVSPFVSFVDNWREAQLAAQNRNNSVACILASTSAELLIRSHLTLLLWDEGISPREAARCLCGNNPNSRPIADILKREFHGRLGGSWDINGDGPVGHLFSNVIQLRNRILHSGHLPTREEVDLALNACTEFYSFFRQRVASKYRKYPLPALMTLGYGGVDQYGLTDEINGLLSEQVLPEDPLETFHRYRYEVERFMEDQDLRNGHTVFTGDLKNADVAFLAYTNGHDEWWLHDPRRRVVCRATPPNLDRDQRTAVKEIRQRVSTEGTPFHGAVSVKLYGVSAAPLSDQPKWYPTHEIWPLLRVDRFPSCRLPIHGDTEDSWPA